ncbi:ArsR family transcriptional regulator [Aeromicrobium sp. 636]|uniref:ArsR family transcriptional regulator n=1 Tax=Aeromicrobium senzhongii TaxID=2663859 RepID=A0A8I0ETP7_9ACTN|nr:MULTISPECIES: helix-turn-helix domain-containing protein [Aeromicrobium]MBC9224942.1 ArsR family transcriptional regulator [Aeromicrobium senzhongii]MCQ3997053.1 ArsR family transcriptional regulator [Aeromicrobium sp. 636]MTB86987.1 ArsR family transcriptional regulator [Aeromicrobium senzhongii]QNL93187.1 ArsR family transcriptional regulator [Aeromicrobium senzhongii]
MKYVNADQEVSHVDDLSTRDRVAESILENGPSTATSLASRLGLTPAAVRRHLEHLVEQGLVESHEERIRGQRRRGRPARVFALTAAGRDTFAHSYDDLAAEALRFLRATGGDTAVMDFARHRLADFRSRYERLLSGVPIEEQASVLAQALTADGFAASASSTPLGEQICQHHCPVAHVAEEFPQLCEAETEVFADLLGSHVQRLATIAHGDGVCTTHLPRAAQTTSTVSHHEGESP